MKKVLVMMLGMIILSGGRAVESALQKKVLLLSGLGEPDPDIAWEKWVDALGTAALVGKPNLKSASITAYSSSVKAEIREAFQKSGREKIGVVAHSAAATAVLEAVLKDKAIREQMVDRVVLISPLIDGVDSQTQDIDAILTFTGMSKNLTPAIAKGSNYFDSYYILIKNTATRIANDPDLLTKYPKVVIITSKDDGMIPVSASNPTILPFVSGLKVRLGLRHGRFVTGKRPILDIKNADDPVYRLSRLFLEDNPVWQTIGRNVNGKDRGEVVVELKGTAAFLKQNGKTQQIELKKNETTERCYVESLEPSRYHIFVDDKDGGEIAVGPAQLVVTQAPLPGMQPPTAIIRSTPSSGPVPLAVSFDGTSSHDDDGDVTEWKWTFGDNTQGSGSNVQHTYVAEGIYTATLTVTDDDDLTGTDAATINVTGPNKPPVAGFTVSPTQGDTNTTFAFNGTSSSDPDGQIASYSWDYGDSSTKGSGATTTHKYSTNGTYSVILTVKDNKGSSDTESAQVKVSAPNQPPSAILTAQQGGTENPLKVVVMLTASDSDGTVASATIDFGEGGVVTITPGLSYYHIYAGSGIFSIVGTATDNSGATTTSNTLKLYDVDGDKFANQYQGDVRGSDCNDADATVHPGAVESPGDNKDSDCDGLDDF